MATTGVLCISILVTLCSLTMVWGQSNEGPEKLTDIPAEKQQQVVISSSSSNSMSSNKHRKLYCHCSECATGVCETDGYCYTTINIDTSKGTKLKYNACLMRDQLLLEDRPLNCENTNRRDQYVKCCDDDNYCNYNISLPYEYKLPEPVGWQNLTLTIVVALLVLLILILLLGVVCCAWTQRKV
ncbi:unnamed protein product, partial [Meganyctiphanes norvegica]